jgi:hypothetical protein
MNILDFAIATQDAKLAALQAPATAPNGRALQEATLDAIRSVRVDALGWCCQQDILEAVRLAWSELETD